MDVRFEVQDLFEKLRPNAKVHETLEDAAEALNEIVARQAKPMGAVENIGDGSDGTSEKSDDEQDEPTARNFRTRKGRLVELVRLSGVFKANNFQRAGLAFAIEAYPRNLEAHISLRPPS